MKTKLSLKDITIENFEQLENVEMNSVDGGSRWDWGYGGYAMDKGIEWAGMIGGVNLGKAITVRIAGAIIGKDIGGDLGPIVGEGFRMGAENIYYDYFYKTPYAPAGLPPGVSDGVHDGIGGRKY